MPVQQLPPVGLGTMRYESPESCVDSVETALEVGYRHLDTAQKYENEREVGRGLARASVGREDVFLATKVAESNLAHDDVLETTRESLERLDVDAVDMLYVHWPAVTYDPEETLAAFNELLAEGATRHVGLANVTPALLDEARDVLDQEPFAVQVEMHPFLPQEELLAYARDHDINVIAYCPLMRGDVFDAPELAEIADDAGLSLPELSIAWICSKGAIPIPKATGEAHLRENFEAAQLDVDPDVLSRVDAIDREHRVVDPPEKGPWNW